MECPAAFWGKRENNKRIPQSWSDSSVKTNMEKQTKIHFSTTEFCLINLVWAIFHTHKNLKLFPWYWGPTLFLFFLKAGYIEMFPNKIKLGSDIWVQNRVLRFEGYLSRVKEIVSLEMFFEY